MAPKREKIKNESDPSLGFGLKNEPSEPINATDMEKTAKCIYWFRKALRLHDNPSLMHAIQKSQYIYPIFILDPWFVQKAKVGPNRWRFLLQSLNDLNEQLIRKNSRLILIRGNPSAVFAEKIKEWDINLICFETDTEPYAKLRDQEITKIATELNVKVETKYGHTLYNPDYVYKKNNEKIPLQYQSFVGALAKIGDPPKPIDEPSNVFNKLEIDYDLYKIPDLVSIGIDPSACGPLLFPGGETEALRRLEDKFKNESWICSFEKPNTSPNSLAPSTTVLSPYLKFGCLSARKFYWRLKQVYAKRKHSMPPVSLEGQLLFREFFYYVGAFTPNFNKIEGNPVCRQIKWDDKPEYVKAWKEARTGFPFIDAIMTQLRTEGWIHHLARHAVACFLTRGDLYCSWEKGQEVFEEYLLDQDWSLNAANWMWLSASAFFHQYFRVYSPIGFGKKTDENGDYIRKYIPVLKTFPAKYIFEPWTAPLEVQKRHNCVIGKDYPRPIVDHNVISKINISRMKKAYEESKLVSTDDGDDKKSRPTSSKSTKNPPKSEKTSPDTRPPSKKSKN
ncbi:6-4 photolyase [Brachionus plicatilis]|uniref:6-4 photolyase n=1 Tax=Brachionus plicatilis TaxID=10195 RepID=A0A3M7T3X0_BRAPC|nr:6-4 photolyase [Brachionus plicatilis]